jgi:hypothetical protein
MSDCRAPRIRGHLRVQLVHDLALGDLTCRQIGEKYGRAEQTIYNFANENKPARTLTFWLIFAVISWLIVWPLVWLGSHAIFSLTGLWVGHPAAVTVLVLLGLVFWLGLTLLVGVISGLVGGLGEGSAPLLLFSEIGLGLRRERVRFMPLLEGALARQVLRQAGAVYQFRHADLQDRLADQFGARLSHRRYSRYVTRRL